MVEFFNLFNALSVEEAQSLSIVFVVDLFRVSICERIET